MHKRGGELCFKTNAQIKRHKSLYWFGLPDLRPVLNHPGRVPLSPGFTTGAPGTYTTTSFKRDHLQPYNHKFYSSSLATFLTSSPLQPARVQPLQIKDFLTKFSLRTDNDTHLSTKNALKTRRDLTTKSTRYVDEKITQWVKCCISFLGTFECLKEFSVFSL